MGAGLLAMVLTAAAWQALMPPPLHTLQLARHRDDPQWPGPQPAPAPAPQGKVG
ncbi:hypothetical protein HNQ50_003984 [Silvimonas terrae]|uniref:Uncharacterized protein n=1 Tax=Silvimonas terrae TaxID=300266 RepID=A0A840RL76_9NEIS|nr:hypothetical protein [Silvimonas terrae]MBB5193230.1 hypothetical protein [Silvimonas terrae]